MNKYADLKELAGALGGIGWNWWTSNSTLRLTSEKNGRHGADGDVISAHHGNVECPEHFQRFIAAANPAAVSGLIADLEAYSQGARVEACAADEARREAKHFKGLVHRMVTQAMPLEDIPDLPGYSRVVDAEKLVKERDRLATKLEVSEDTLKTIRGCLRDAGADIDRLKAQLEVAMSGMKAAVETANWQSVTNRDLNSLTESNRQLQAKNERLLADFESLSNFNPDWDRVAAAQDSVREHMAVAVQLKAENEALRQERVPAGLYRELVALRELRDQAKAYVDGYMLDEVEDVESCVSEDQHLSASALSERLMDAFEAHWDAAMSKGERS